MKQGNEKIAISHAAITKALTNRFLRIGASKEQMPTLLAGFPSMEKFIKKYNRNTNLGKTIRRVRKNIVSDVNVATKTTKSTKLSDMADAMFKAKYMRLGKKEIPEKYKEIIEMLVGMEKVSLDRGPTVVRESFIPGFLTPDKVRTMRKHPLLGPGIEEAISRSRGSWKSKGLMLAPPIDIYKANPALSSPEAYRKMSRRHEAAHFRRFEKGKMKHIHEPTRKGLLTTIREEAIGYGKSLKHSKAIPKKELITNVLKGLKASVEFKYGPNIVKQLVLGIRK